jgi:hypothetical protein
MLNAARNFSKLEAASCDDPPMPAQPAPQERCRNCGTPRLGPYCHVCGQHAHALHRSIRRLTAEGLRAATDSEGPFLRTLRRLALNPAQLTNDYLGGKQASQISPVRLFLFALALFLVVAEHNVVVEMSNPTPAQLAMAPAWFRPLAHYADANGLSFLHAMHSSAELFAILTVPIAALLLKLVYLDRHRLTLYDHAIVAAYSLSFQLVMLAIIVAIPDRFSTLGWLPFIAMCVHLFAQLKGVYGGSALLILLRMAGLAICSLMAFAALFVCWLLVAGLLVAA